ncbi:MAG TPA: transcriptional repressor LexA [Anaerolineales bacterium]|nr:transcriptional repressor LexA [Anaerolineae bacterium]HIQ02226.1 transcriptional repressor LexA [Anaerolineales bacterium]
MEERLRWLTERQRGILRHIWESVNERGYPPSIREIGRAVGISSTSVVNYNLERLEREGLIERDRGFSRGLRLSAAGEALFSPPEGHESVVAIPMLGVIVAGEPIPVPPSDFSLMGIEETVELTRGILGDQGDLFALRVQGDSMIDALIHDGDIVIMRQARRVENGEMAAVWLRDREETTLKRVYWEGGRVRLQPANPTMEPIYVNDPTQVEVQGKVVMVIRRVH